MTNIIERDCAEIAKRVPLGMLAGKRVLVTGASGFLGQYLVSAIYFANKKNNLNCRVVCVGLRGPSDVLGKYLPDDNIVFKKMDLAKPLRALRSEKFDYIFHAGGYGQPAKFTKDPRGTASVNIRATKELLDIAERSRGTFIFFSSAEIYGAMPKGMKAFKEAYAGKPLTEGPRAVYAASKLAGEALVAQYAKRGVNAKTVRISHVYGPGAPKDDSRVMSDFIRKACVSHSIELLDEGRAVKTYGYIADVIAMILFVALRGKQAIYNVGGSDTFSIRELARKIGKICGAKVKVPRAASKKYFVGRDPGFVKLDLSRIKKEMKIVPHTSFGAGLANAIGWFGSIS